MAEYNPCAAIVASLDAPLACLSDRSARDRPQKKRAMDTVKDKAFDSAPKDTALGVLDTILGSLLLCTESSIENIREQTVNLLQGLTSRIPELTPQTRKILVKTAPLRANKAVENVEEIRLLWVAFMHNILEKHILKDKIEKADSEHCIQLIQLAVDDTFPEIQREGAKMLDTFARHQTRSTQLLGERGVLIAVPLLRHKHAGVRVLGVKAIHQVLLSSKQGLPILFEKSYQDASQTALIPGLLYDASVSVREQLHLTLGDLLVQWPPSDRYTYAALILPILLAGTSDELDSVRNTCKMMFEGVGLTCAQDLVDAGITEIVPTWQSGLEHLVHQCYDACLKSLMIDSHDFIETKQATTLSTLALFLEYASEGDILQTLPKIINHLIILSSKGCATKCTRIVHTLQSKVDLEIMTDMLLLQIESRRLSTEASGLPGADTVAVVTALLVDLFTGIDASQLSSPALKKVLVTLKRPYLKQYWTEATEEHIIALQRFLTE